MRARAEPDGRRLFAVSRATGRMRAATVKPFSRSRKLRCAAMRADEIFAGDPGGTA